MCGCRKFSGVGGGVQLQPRAGSASDRVGPTNLYHFKTPTWKIEGRGGGGGGGGEVGGEPHIPPLDPLVG